MPVQTFDAGPVTINYFEEGEADGPPLVFLHGVTALWQAWTAIMPAFAEEYRVHALDFRGHGRSGRVADGYRAVDYAADVIAFLRGRAHRPAHLVGHSLGAIVAIAVAADAPEAVRSVVLEDPPLGAFSDQRLAERRETPTFRAWRDLALRGLPKEQLFAELARMQPAADAAAVGARATSLSQMDPDVLTMILEDRAKDDYRLEERLARVRCPVLLQQGDAELGAALEDERAEKARSLLANCTFERFADVGHLIHTEQPYAFIRSVRRFLRGV